MLLIRGIINKRHFNGSPSPKGVNYTSERPGLEEEMLFTFNLKLKITRRGHENCRLARALEVSKFEARFLVAPVASNQWILSSLRMPVVIECRAHARRENKNSNSSEV